MWKNDLSYLSIPVTKIDTRTREKPRQKKLSPNFRFPGRAELASQNTRRHTRSLYFWSIRIGASWRTDHGLESGGRKVRH